MKNPLQLCGCDKLTKFTSTCNKLSLILPHPRSLIRELTNICSHCTHLSPHLFHRCASLMAYLWRLMWTSERLISIQLRKLSLEKVKVVEEPPLVQPFAVNFVPECYSLFSFKMFPTTVRSIFSFCSGTFRELNLKSLVNSRFGSWLQYFFKTWPFHCNFPKL